MKKIDFWAKYDDFTVFLGVPLRKAYKVYTNNSNLAIIWPDFNIFDQNKILKSSKLLLEYPRQLYKS